MVHFDVICCCISSAFIQVTLLMVHFCCICSCIWPMMHCWVPVSRYLGSLLVILSCSSPLMPLENSPLYFEDRYCSLFYGDIISPLVVPAFFCICYPFILFLLIPAHILFLVCCLHGTFISFCSVIHFATPACSGTYLVPHSSHLRLCFVLSLFTAFDSWRQSRTYIIQWPAVWPGCGYSSFWLMAIILQS